MRKLALVALSLACAPAQAATTTHTPGTYERPVRYQRIHILPPGGFSGAPSRKQKKKSAPVAAPRGQTIHLRRGVIELRGTYDPGLPYFTRPARKR